ncbi:Receptor expression-enhancing protein, partial [Trichostrongylus colubriformis]
VVFAVLSVAEFFSHQILAVFPVYWLFKSLFLLWLYLPSTMGATKVYHKAIKPVFMKHHASVDHRLGHIADKARDAMKNAANDVIDKHLE